MTITWKPADRRRTWLQTLATVACAVGLTLVLPARSADAEMLMGKMKAAGQVTVGTEAQMAPYEFMQDGKIVGYGKDILDCVVADLGVKRVQLDVPWQGILPGVLAGKFDFIATSVALLPERTAKYAFTMPIGCGQDLAVKRRGDDSIKTVDDVSGRVAGTQLASSSEISARKFDEKIKASSGEGFSDIKLYTSHPDAALALASGEVDVMITGLDIFGELDKQRPGLFEIVGPVGEKTFVSWVTRPQDKDFRDYLNTKIKELRDSGKLYELQERWFGYRMEVPETGYLPEGAI